MNRDQIYEELSRLTALADGWRKAAEVPAIERDLMLERLRGLYGALMFETPADASPELTAAAAAAVAAAEDDDTNEVIDIMLDDEFDEPEDAATEPAEESSDDTVPAADEPAEEEEPEEEEELLPEIEVGTATGFESAFAEDAEESGTEEGPLPETEETATVLPAEEESPAPMNVSEPENTAEPAAAEETMTAPAADDEPAIAAGTESAPEASEEEPAFTEDSEAEYAFDIEPAAEPDVPEFEIEPAPVAEPDEAAAGTAAPEFIVEPADEQPAATGEPAVELPTEQPAGQQTAAPQSNLFGFDPVVAPRRSRHRMISLYDDDLFERIPVRKADKPQTDEPQFEVVMPSEPANSPDPAPQPVAADAGITVVTAADDAFSPAEESAAGRDDMPAATFIVDAGSSEEEEDFSIEAAVSTAAEPAKVVLGDILGSDRRTIADSMAAQQTTTADALAHAPVTDLAAALSIGDRYRIESELFGGDAERCRRALETLDGMESLDDAVIYIEENFSWHPNSEAACLVMELLERKFS